MRYILRSITIAVVVAFVSTGCVSTSAENRTAAKIKEGIVDAVFTVVEYSPKDREGRINRYLDSKVKDGHITKEDKEIIELCIKRYSKAKK